MLHFDEKDFRREAAHGQIFDSPPNRTTVPVSKRVFDVGVSILLLPVLACVALALFVINPLLNRGPLMYFQRRMGQRGQPFRAFKFRTMRPVAASARGAYDRLEEDRISRMGRILRKVRIDELPQIINVLRGEMSMIGPRPDLYDHACVYLDSVPGYAARQQMLPGISGYAQTEVGYVDGKEGIQRKVAADLYYAMHASFLFDLWIAWRTVCVIVGRKGR
ncbi:lipopolysaccharide/colanic/teichoic acid biosynthesis glycosyltransferase [Yoonia maricola]|uniref:Lipopolysaccharide/colanic/teichoic acid biosynthesis glycosyltransferase n=1 Tax=Yoonia maricola TaxID=420999 RepID=A0A2M8W2I7_9RHOB|nr:sugar transferase [Yoonia maricola]PJI85118.1 lipopolysaccharide/colanic/teichoic acid biosynthesis glycosyltransferase [Yoonia maricola]